MCLDAAAVIPLLWASHVPLAEERLRELKARWVRWVLHHPASHFSLINSTIPFAARSPVPPRFLASAVRLGLPALPYKEGSLDTLLLIAVGEEGLYGFTPAQMNFPLFLQTQTQTQWNVFHFWPIFPCCFYGSVVFCG